MKIIIDTREQEGIFYFKSYGDVDIINRKLSTGDYSCESFEQIVTIDRKASTNELQKNFGSDSKRFNKELERMKDITYCYFVCCFPYSYLEEFPVNSGIPKNRWKYLKVKGAYLRRRVKEIEEEYPNIKFIFCNNQSEGENITYQILKKHTKEIINGQD